jgi:3-methylfumaryl-CoA hydratase
VSETESNTVVEESDVVADGSALAMHGLLDAPGQAPMNGDPLPPLWHWLAFLPRIPQRDIGPDGHPIVNEFFDSEAYPRRMFAGARISWPGTAHVGEQLTRRSRIANVVTKEGRTGPLLFLTVENEIYEHGDLVIREEQDLVYRAASGSSPAAPSRDIAVDEQTWTWSLPVTIDPVSLFRFSALTYNAHRIHYDRAYATQTEGYPGLVVHGPFQAISLAEVCRRFHPESSLASFAFRAQKPAFEGTPLRFCGRGEGDEIELAALDGSGHVTVSAAAKVISIE